jgi:hypothetical protein
MSAWLRSGQLNRETLRDVIQDVWRTLDFPRNYLRRSRWLELFKWIGFVSDSGTQLTAPITVYRGAAQTTVRRLRSTD